MIVRVISGAQTGADRAGLDAALHLGIDVGGCVPYGWRTDEGPLCIGDRVLYKLRQHESAEYPPRTEQNVIDSDATVIFGDPSSPGSRLTRKLCKQHGKPVILATFEKHGPIQTAINLRKWIVANNVKVLNVAGNRERKNPGIYKLTYDTLLETLR